MLGSEEATRTKVGGPDGEEPGDPRLAPKKKN